MTVGIPKTAQRGSLLLEVLLGFTLVLFAILAIFRLFPAAESAARLADRTAHARILASQTLESYLRRPYYAYSVGEWEDEEPIAHTLRKGVDEETVYYLKVVVSRPYAGRDIYRVVVSVSWQEGADDRLRDNEITVEGEKGRHW